MNFDSFKVYVLENDVLILRQLQESNIEHLLPYATIGPAIWHYSIASAIGIQGMKNYLKNAISLKNDGKDYPFLVFDKRLGQYTGSTRFFDIQPTTDTVKLRYTWYGKKNQSMGFNRHCKYLMLQFAFEIMGVQSVEFRAENRNQSNIEGTLLTNGYTASGSRKIALFSVYSEKNGTEVSNLISFKIGKINQKTISYAA